MAEKGFSMNNVIPETPKWVTWIRYFQIGSSVLSLALCAYALDYYGTWWGAGSLGFAIFNSIWSLLFTLAIVLVPMFFPQFFYKWIALGAECITVIFWLATWAVLASWSASFDDSYYGRTYSRSSGWGCVTAAAVFGAFTWISFCVTLTMFSLALHRYRMDNSGVEMPQVAGPMVPEEPDVNYPTYQDQSPHNAFAQQQQQQPPHNAFAQQQVPV